MLAAPDNYSAALAAVIATYLWARLCITSRLIQSSSIIAESYRVGSDLIDIAAISRECIQKKSKVLVVIADASNLNVLAATCSIVLKCHSNIVGVFSLIGPKYEIYKSYLSSKLKLVPKIVLCTY